MADSATAANVGAAGEGTLGGTGLPSSSSTSTTIAAATAAASASSMSGSAMVPPIGGSGSITAATTAGLNNNNGSEVSTTNGNNNNNNALGGGIGPMQGQQALTSGQQPPQQQQQYTIPGILHYLQYEWQRFELERQQWEVERAELQARISHLQGERKGQENLKNDLIRRIKMLEYCLQQERAKFFKLKYGQDMPSLGGPIVDEQFNNDPLLDESLLLNNGDNSNNSTANVSWRNGRQLLRQYLQEIGYTDTIIDVRSNRVRSLLGLNHTSSNEDSNLLAVDPTAKVNTAAAGQPGGGGKQPPQQQQPQRRPQQVTPASAIVADAEASVLATFEFLNDQRDGSAGRNAGSTDDDEEIEEDDDMNDDDGRAAFPIDSETEEVLAEFDFLSHQGADQKDPASGWRPGAPKNDIVDIGELAALTVANESMDMNGGTNSNTALQNTLNSEFRKTWNPRYILKSHFDCIRCLRFHATEPLLVTCSEDETLKLWNLNKTQQPSNKGKQQTASSGTTYDLEPVYTYRGHTARVLTMTLAGNVIYSGAQNGELFIWSVPSNIATIDPYDAFDSSLSAGQLAGHDDAIWSLLTIESSEGAPLLCSASADCTIKVWDVSKQQCVNTIATSARPTCLAAISPHNNNNALSHSGTGSLVAASFADGSVAIYNIEQPGGGSSSSNSPQPVLAFENGSSSRINSIVVHPTLPVLVSAHEDRQIKFWDLGTGKCLHAMVAHLDEVTCLACDPNGLYLLSGSHDCSVRLWNFENRTCVQEITSHRKKFDEAIFDVTFHSSKPFFASAGADGLAKVFV